MSIESLRLDRVLGRRDALELGLAAGVAPAFRWLPPGHFLSSPAAGRGSVYAGTCSDVVIGFDLRV